MLQGVDIRRSTRKLSSGFVLAVIGLLLVAGTALAAAHFAPGRKYTAKSPPCSPHAIPNTSCTFVFKASTDGRSLKFIGKTVVDTWSCRNGGGEALLGGKARYATPIPNIVVGSGGKLSGSVQYVFRPTSAPPEHHTYSVTGLLSRSGKSATITLHDKVNGSRSGCTVGPITLTETG